MTLAVIQSVLSGLLPELRAQGVVELRVFGSFARGDQDASSDIDLLVELSSPDYKVYCAVLDRVESALMHKVDLVMIDALKPRYRERVLREAKRVA